jgi:gamma-glutamyl:cysteine ligase YbdK (ATP-grasp superfamily)
MSRTATLPIFAAYGIELEYMIVDRNTLAVRPISDELLKAAAGGELLSEVEFEKTAWSNELVMHVLELKTNGPTADLKGLPALVHADIKRINELLAPHGAMLMPTAMHPTFDPDRELKLWPHDSAEIYAAYNRIFDCRGHGWSNLQSMHVNLPFSGDEEFGRLHAAIRMVLPVLPALAASSPIYGGKPSGLLDSRLEFYRNNQRRVPSLTGGVIPEPAFTKADYDAMIFQKIYRDIAPHDPDRLLQDEWLNSRGAIARFDRNAIEIRVLDIQESPRMDMAVATTVISAVQGLADGLFMRDAAQRAWTAEALRPMFVATLKDAGDAVVNDKSYLEAFGMRPRGVTRARDLWRHIADQLMAKGGYPLADYGDDLALILDEGCLAKRILATTGPSPTTATLGAVYRELAETLARNGVFRGG